jgi:hypothetical protein
MKSIRYLPVLLVLSSGPALAQWDAYWNASGPHPISCLFNGQEFYVDDDVCVGAGVKQVCLADGSLGVRQNSTDCTGPVAARPAITKAHGRHAIACTFGESRYSVGAEICVAPGSKQVCQGNGTLAVPEVEPACHGAVRGSGG